MIIKNFKILSKYLLKRLYKLIIKKSLKGKQVMPNNFPVYIYEIFNNINEVKQYDKKIIMPYIDIDNYNIMNIYRPYEIMEATNIPPKSSLRINLNNKHNDIVLPIALLDKKGLNENLNETIEIMVGTKKTKSVFSWLPFYRRAWLPIFSVCGRPKFSDGRKRSASRLTPRNYGVAPADSRPAPACKFGG